MRLNELFNTKKKKITVSVWMIGLIIVVSGFVYFTRSKTYLKLKKDEFVIEYGKTISMNAEDYLSKDVDKEVIKTVKIEPIIENEKGKEYPAVGIYKVTLTYKDEKTIAKVIVKDTTKPVIEGVESIDMIQETDLTTYDFNSLFTITDLSQVETNFDTSKIDVNTVGSYTLKVVATDKYKNKAKLDVPVNVTEKPVVSEDEELVTETIIDSNGRKKTVVTTKKKPNSSSNQNNSSQGSSSSSKPSTGGNTSSSGSTSLGSNQPIVSEPCYTSTYFIDDMGNKWQKGVNYVYASLDYNDVINYYNNLEADFKGFANENLLDGREIWYIKMPR